MDIQSVIGNYKYFLDKIFRNLEKKGFLMNEFKELDHIAYRTENLKSYKKITEELTEFFAESTSDKIFNGRLIFVCRLRDPLVCNPFFVKGIEVLAPTENNKFKDGLEHAEFVVKDTLEEFKKNHNYIDFNLDAYDRKENPELIIDFKDCSAKFHTQSLLEIRKI